MPFIYLGLFAATVGLFIATHIYQSKRANRPLVCPRRNDCNKVVTSRYAKTMGIPNETLGVGYYVLVAGFFAAALSIPALDIEVLQFAVALSAIAGMFFSLYLVYVQAVKLHAWCLWCLLSAGITLLLVCAANGWISSNQLEALPTNQYTIGVQQNIFYNNQQ